MVRSALPLCHDCSVALISNQLRCDEPAPNLPRTWTWDVGFFSGAPYCEGSQNYFLMIGDWGRADAPGPCQQAVAQHMQLVKNLKVLRSGLVALIGYQGRLLSEPLPLDEGTGVGLLGAISMCPLAFGQGKTTLPASSSKARS